jgi:AcrR family transcriptional regulator
MQLNCIDAAILQPMAKPVKRDLREARRAETEARLLEAATRLFVRRGYAATTLTDVAAQAGLAPRTLYLHFATKADLLRRCIGVAIAGDAAPVAVGDRPELEAAMTAPTLDERLQLLATLTATLMRRTGPLLEVAQQATATEPTIAAAAQAGRDDTRRNVHAFWHRCADDGLLPGGADLDWLTETATVLTHADTYLLVTRTTGWDADTYERWLLQSWRRLVAGSTAGPAQELSP